jgi:hypothetical protein
MSIRGWSRTGLRARIALLVAVLGLVAGLHAVAPSRAHAMDNDGTCGGEVCVTDDGSGGVGGGTGYGDTGGGDWGDTGGGDWGDPSTGNPSAGDPSAADPSAGDSDDTGGFGDYWGDRSVPPDQDQGDNRSSDSVDTTPAGVEDPSQGRTDDPMPPEKPPEADAISGADSATYNFGPCGAEYLAWVRAPQGSESEDMATVEYDACIARMSHTDITGRIETPGGPAGTGPVAMTAAAQQTTQARVQLHAANLAARAATQAAMSAAAKAEQQAGRGSARRAPAKPKAAGKRHVKKRRG